MNSQNQWNSRIAFLLSMIGAAVGLGNIWRYSYVVYVVIAVIILILSYIFTNIDEERHS
jgi:SNF family Na+-dependent transporter